MPARVDLYLKLGRHYVAQHDYDLAINALTRAIELEPDNAHTYCRRGAARAKKEEYDEALRDFDRAIRLDFSYAGAYNNRALTYYRLGMFKESLADYNRAIELSPDVGLFYADRGLLHHHRGEYDEAIADYTRAIDLDPTDTEALNNRGETYAHLGEYDKALADFDEALDIDPGHIQACANRALVMSLMGQRKGIKEPSMESVRSSYCQSSQHASDVSRTARRKRNPSVKIEWQEISEIGLCGHGMLLGYGTNVTKIHPQDRLVVAYAEEPERGWYDPSWNMVRVKILKPDSPEFVTRGLDGEAIVAEARRAMAPYLRARMRKLPPQDSEIGPCLAALIHA